MAASSRSDLRPSFTNFGAASVQMAAPGSSILSTTPNNTYDYASGTSMAAPHVTGAAALISATDGIISMRRLRSALLYSGDVLEAQNYYTNLATGRRLNAFSALQAVNDTDPTRPAAVGNFQMSNPYFKSVSLSWVAPGDDGNVGQAAVYEIRFSDTDLSAPLQFELARPLAAPLPKPAGGFENLTLEIPWRHTSGFIGIRAIDNAGNTGPITSIPVSVGTEVGDPYIITESAPTPLSTGGTPLGLVADDEYKVYNLPFAFQFFGRTRYFNNITVSTNGTLFFGNAPTSMIDASPDDVENTSNRLGAHNMIAGLWDDLRTDKRPGDDVYVVKPDADRIIFRWQAVTYDTPLSPGVTRGENPVNFEIELNRNGTIQVRYGDGNRKLFSVVGAGGGMPDAYLIDSHTAKFDLKDLTNAPTVTFAFRPLAPPSADLEMQSFGGAPNPVTSGQQLRYLPSVRNRGPNDAAGVTLTISLPAGTSFVSCTTTKGTCTGPAPGTNGGTATANFGSLFSGELAGMTVTVQVNAAAGATLTSSASVSSSTNDSNSANNSATTTNGVIADVVVPPAIQFTQSSYSVNESQPYATITVTRTGDTSTPATVKYTTSDTTDVHFRCDPSTAGQPTGAASRKCDYHIAVGRLRFAAGESSKQIILSIVNDSYLEGAESLTIALSNATGTPLGTTATATVTIVDNDTAASPNPIEGTSFYVRQLYVDLLSREPDSVGWNGWTNIIDLCGQPGQTPPPCDRVTVGGDGFLRSAEFFDRQFFVIRLYRTGLGRILNYDEVGDLAYVSGFLSDAHLELNKQDLVLELMGRAEFANRYNALTHAAFVDTLLQTAAVSVPQSVRDAWVATLNGNTRTRAQVYREVSERQEISSRYLHEAQVVSAYYGFFSRNPDGAYFTYLEWLDKGQINLGGLANSFINAQEYRQRFGN